MKDSHQMITEKVDEIIERFYYQTQKKNESEKRPFPDSFVLLIFTPIKGAIYCSSPTTI